MSNIKRLHLNWIAVVGILLAAVILCGVTMRLTKNFTELSPDKVFSYAPNQENLFHEKIEDGPYEFIYDVEAIAKNGVITLNGGVESSGSGAVVADEPIEFLTIEIPKGTYTFTAFEKPSAKKAFAVGEFFNKDGDICAWVADVGEVTRYYGDALTDEGYEVCYGQTVTLTEDTEVTFKIIVIEGASFDDYKVYPCVVEGSEAGGFYNESIFDK